MKRQNFVRNVLDRIFSKQNHDKVFSVKCLFVCREPTNNTSIAITLLLNYLERLRNNFLEVDNMRLLTEITQIIYLCTGSKLTNWLQGTLSYIQGSHNHSTLLTALPNLCPTSSLYLYFLRCHSCSPSSQLLGENHKPVIPTCIT